MAGHRLITAFDFASEHVYTLTMAEERPPVALRDASPGDMPFITEHIEKFLLDDEDLDYRQFVVATEGEEIVGFGRIRPHKKVYELGSVGVVESKRNRGIGKMIIERLIAIFPTDNVYITTDIPQYFERFGFRETEQPPEELIEKIRRLCEIKCRQPAVVMLYQRRPHINLSYADIAQKFI